MKAWQGVLLKAGVSVLVIVVIVLSLDFSAVAGLFARMDYGWLLPALAVLPVSVLMRVLRWQYLMNAGQSRHISLGVATRVALAGMALNIFMPAQAGEVLKGYFGYQWTGVKERMFSISFFDKVIAVAGVGLLGLVPALYLGRLWFLLAALAAIAPLFLLAGALRHQGLKRYAGRIFRKLFKGRVDFQEAATHFSFKPRRMAVALLLSIAGWMLIFLMLWLCFMALSHTPVQPPSLGFVFMVAPLLTLGRLFPFTLSGLGTDEALMVFLFRAADIPSEVSFAAAILFKLLQMILPGLLGVVVIVVSKKVKKLRS
jgi:glycosyltransferase 2 family protein